MKKYVALALLTCAVCNLSAAETSDYPTLQEAASRASRRARKKAVGATIAHQEHYPSISIDMGSAEFFEPEPQDLGKSVMISRAAAEELRKAAQLKQQKDELERRTKEQIERLSATQKELDAKIKEKEQITAEKADKLETYIQEEADLAQQARQAEEKARSLIAQLEEARAACTQAEEAARAGAQQETYTKSAASEKSTFVRSRRDSLSQAIGELERFKAQKACVECELQEHGVSPEGDVHERMVISKQVADAESQVPSSSWLATLASFATLWGNK